MLDLKLEGKRALVTGSTSGIGEAIARTLGSQGAAVVVHGRNADRAQRVADDINAGRVGRAVVALGDLGREEDAERVADRAIEALGGVDILVNNAGRSGGRKSGLDATIDEWEDLFDANLFSAVRMIRALVPGMREQGWGRVIQIASVVARQPRPDGPAYAATKAALVNLTVSLAKDLAGTGITVNSVSPGPIVTPLFERLVREMAKARGWGEDWQEIERRAVNDAWWNPVGRFGRPEEVAALVAFLASPLAGFIDGADLSIDGGRGDVDPLAAGRALRG